MIDLTFRCFSRTRWVTVASNRGICDSEGIALPGFTIDEIGSVVLVPGDPPTMDTWFWVNLRIHGQAAEADGNSLYPGENEDGFKFTKSKLAKFVRDQASVVNLSYGGKTIRTYQFGAAANRIQLLDPRDYMDVRVREWLGGPQY